MQSAPSKKRIEIPDPYVSMLEYVRVKYGLADHDEALRVCISHTFQMEQCLDDNMILQFTDLDGTVKGVLFK